MCRTLRYRRSTMEHVSRGNEKYSHMTQNHEAVENLSFTEEPKHFRNLKHPKGAG